MSWDKKYLKDTHEKIHKSTVFLSIFTDNYKEDPTALVQLVFAAMMDKPIYLIVPYGTYIPKKIVEMADKIEFFKDKEEMEQKITSMLKDGMI